MVNHELLEKFRDIRPRRYLDAGREPDPWLVEQLKVTHPFVRLAWEPKLERWALYEEIGSLFTFIVAIADAEGNYEHPSWANTIDYLSMTADSVRRVANKHDIDRWLDREIDSHQTRGAQEIRARTKPQIEEGSDRIWSLLNNKTQIQRP